MTRSIREVLQPARRARARNQRRAQHRRPLRARAPLWSPCRRPVAEWQATSKPPLEVELESKLHQARVIAGRNNLAEPASQTRLNGAIGVEAGRWYSIQITNRVGEGYGIEEVE